MDHILRRRCFSKWLAAKNQKTLQLTISILNCSQKLIGSFCRAQSIDVIGSPHGNWAAAFWIKWSFSASSNIAGSNVSPGCQHQSHSADGGKICNSSQLHHYCELQFSCSEASTLLRSPSSSILAFTFVVMPIMVTHLTLKGSCSSTKQQR